MMPVDRLNVAQIETFVERLIPLLRGRIHGVTLPRLARQLETETDAYQTIYHRLREWSRRCKDSHGLGFWRSGPKVPFVVYLASEPFDPPVPGERLLCSECQTNLAESRRLVCSTCRHRTSKQRKNRAARVTLKGATAGTSRVTHNHYQRPRVPVHHCPECGGMAWRRRGRCPGCGGMPGPEKVAKSYVLTGVQWDF